MHTIRFAALLLVTSLLIFVGLRDTQTPDRTKAKGGGGSLIQDLDRLQAGLKGKLEKITIHSKALEGNLEGDSPDRDVFVYLPPSYATQPNRRYPVVYTLHGYGLHARQWVGFANVGGLERGVAAGKVKEMILVAPDAFTQHNGSFYSSSKTIGNWEDFIARELVGYIDSHFRTVADRASRGLAGHSMGGYGTWRIGMKHPEVYSAMYPMSACCALGTGEATEAIARVVGISKEDAAKLPYDQKRPLARAAAWSSNPSNPPLYLDLPVKDGRQRGAIAAAWMANSAIVMAQQYAPNLKKMKAIAFDVGTQDGLIQGNRDMDDALTILGVPHTFEVFEGDHNGQVPENFEKKVLPFFSKNLVFPK